MDRATARERFRSRAVHPAEPRLLSGGEYTGALVIIAQKAQTRTDQANEAAAAKHREELGQYQTDLLQKNTDLTVQIHALTEQLSALTEQVHAATCGHSSAT